MNKYKNWHFVDFGGIRHYFSGLTDEQMMNMKIERLKIPERSNVLACFGIAIHKENVKGERLK